MYIYIRIISSREDELLPSTDTRMSPWVWVSDFRFRVLGFGFRISDFGFRVSGFGFRISGFSFRFSGISPEIQGSFDN